MSRAGAPQAPDEASIAAGGEAFLTAAAIEQQWTAEIRKNGGSWVQADYTSFQAAIEHREELRSQMAVVPEAMRLKESCATIVDMVSAGCASLDEGGLSALVEWIRQPCAVGFAPQGLHWLAQVLASAAATSDWQSQQTARLAQEVWLSYQWHAGGAQ